MIWTLPTIITSNITRADTDAEAFISASGVDANTYRIPLTQLVQTFKGLGVWSLCNAIWPFVGTTSTTQKFNLKDPRDLDAAFRLTFSGSWTFSATGALPDGSTAFAQTHFIPNSNGILLNNNAFGLYSRTVTAGSSTENTMGSTNSATQNWAIITRRSTNVYFGIDMTSGTGGTVTGASTDGSGFWLNSRTSSSAFTLYKNGSVVQTNGFTNVGTLIPTVQMYIGATNSNGTAAGFANKEIAFAIIFTNGISSALQLKVYNAIQNFQRALGRNV